LKMWEVWDWTNLGEGESWLRLKQLPTLWCNGWVWQLNVSCCMFAIGFSWLKFSRCESRRERYTK
jgi:hypothetical protein